MSPFRIATWLFGFGLLAGCATDSLRRVDTLSPAPAPSTIPVEQARAELEAQPLCCGTLRELPYQPVPLDFIGNVEIGPDAPAFAFDSGKSFFRAFELPAGDRSFEIRLYSQAGNTVLAPRAMVLDSQFRMTRLLDADDFMYVPASGFKGDSLDARLRIDRLYAGHPASERYLILYTSEQQMSGQTQLEHPAKAYARALGNQPPNIADPIARHSPAGVVRMVLVADREAGQQAGHYVPPYSTGREMGVEMAGEKAPAVLPETRAYYRQGIDAALAAKDVERALRLADEAARVGDQDAKAYLLERIEIR